MILIVVTRIRKVLPYEMFECSSKSDGERDGYMGQQPHPLWCFTCFTMLKLELNCCWKIQFQALLTRYWSYHKQLHSLYLHYAFHKYVSRWRNMIYFNINFHVMQLQRSKFMVSVIFLFKYMRKMQLKKMRFWVHVENQREFWFYLCFPCVRTSGFRILLFFWILIYFACAQLKIANIQVKCM